MNDQAVTELTSEECWEMLRGEEFGRLAYRLVDEVHITPINYAVEGGCLLFRIGEGNKLLAVAVGSEVAFEIGALRSHAPVSLQRERGERVRG